MARKWVDVDDRRELLEEAYEVTTLAMYASMLSPDLEGVACGSYGRLVELAEELDMPAPPLLAEVGKSGASTPLDAWLSEGGLYHSGRRWCDLRDGGHWAHQCG
ncbi:hypothetical protein [Streptosporangium minutum]|uniref:Uncharacterized protein n=1 Tax=Streptosporangium minutum TaxID=569862 RepID=A0A243RMA0_9ACTN|nr:hypothetical protein [Streptosporangium minutum]OUC96066.1 hypothetical protein CA984_16435 [Streptosporangium minutum]